MGLFPRSSLICPSERRSRFVHRAIQAGVFEPDRAWYISRPGRRESGGNNCVFIFGRAVEIAEMADGLTWAGIAGIGILAGLRFTVALFISGLSFADETLVATAKVAVLAASLAAGIIGYFCLRFSLKDNSVRS